MLAKHLTPQLCQSSPDTLFVFGDNLIGKGTAGQACIRHEPNAFGIPTKRLPSMGENAFFSDRGDEMDAVIQRLRQLYRHARDNNMKVCWPEAGLGTGLAQMPSRSPKVYARMMTLIREHFDNPYRDTPLQPLS